MGYKIVITCDRTLASDYHGLYMMGYLSSYPEGIPPDWIFYRFISPSAKVDAEGRLIKANYGMRKIEAALLNNGFTSDEVVLAHPDHIDKLVGPETKIVGISAIDPLGVGPVTNTTRQLFGKPGKMVRKLKNLINSDSIKKYKPYLVLGGAGAWEFTNNPEKQKELGIDTVIVGEGDRAAPEFFKKVLNRNGEEMPRIIMGENTSDDDIKDIVNPSLVGLVEIMRGCGRSCAFCEPSVKKIKSRPVENIIKEIQVNIDNGFHGTLLHGEDLLLYKSDGLSVNHEGVIDLITRVINLEGLNWLVGVHTAFSSVLSSPQTIVEIAKILELGTKKNPVNYFQMGIETGSPRLIEKHMKGKVYPYDSKEWPDVVRKGMKILHDNHFTMVSSLILGLPGEEEEDIQHTIDLVKTLRPYRTLLIPLLFSPLDNTNLEYSQTMTKENLTDKHLELYKACWEHNFKWLPIVLATYSGHMHWRLRSIIKVLSVLGLPVLKALLRLLIFKHRRKRIAKLKS